MYKYSSEDAKRLQGGLGQNSSVDGATNPQPVIVRGLLPLEVFFRSHTGTNKRPSKPKSFDLSHYQLHPQGCANKRPFFKGKPMRCRKATCSLQCWRNYANRQQAILTQYLTKHLPKTYPLYLFNLKFNQTIEQDKTAKQQITSQIQKLETDLDCILRFRCWLHLTKTGWHYDGILYSSCEHPLLPSKVFDVFRPYCVKRYPYISRHVRGNGDDLKGLSRYVTKDKQKHFVYLPQPKGHPLHLETMWGSRNWAKQKDRGFYVGINEDDLWEEIKLTFGGTNIHKM